MAIHDSHRRALALLCTAVRGAPRLRSSVHSPATLECEQPWLPVLLLWLVDFGTILAVLAVLLRTACSRFQVLLRPTARHARTQPSLTTRCAPCAAGARLTLPFNHLSIRAKWLGCATTCSRA